MWPWKNGTQYYFVPYSSSCLTCFILKTLFGFQQSIDKYKIKVLVFSIQYAFKILKYQFQYSIWKILKQYQYQYIKNTEVSVFSISIFCENNLVITQHQIRTTIWSKVIYHYKKVLLKILIINGQSKQNITFFIYFWTLNLRNYHISSD